MNTDENDQISENMINEDCADERTDSVVFAERLRTIREKTGKTVQEFADMLAVSKSIVEKWENGKREPSLRTLSDIAFRLDVPTDYLLGLVDSDGSSKDMNISDRAKAILDRARDQSDEQALFFETTFTRYIEQIALLKKLKKAIDDHGVLVLKKNVKGDDNLTSNPALKDYVSVSAQANETGKLLIRFVQEPLEDDSDKDELEMFLSRR